jgi:hypothetical protein
MGFSLFENPAEAKAAAPASTKSEPEMLARMADVMSVPAQGRGFQKESNADLIAWMGEQQYDSLGG